MALERTGDGGSKTRAEVRAGAELCAGECEPALPGVQPHPAVVEGGREGLMGCRGLQGQPPPVRDKAALVYLGDHSAPSILISLSQEALYSSIPGAEVPKAEQGAGKKKRAEETYITMVRRSCGRHGQGVQL